MANAPVALSAISLQALFADPLEAALLCLHIMRGVAHMHAHGLTHGDVKPANVLRVASGQWALCDLACSLPLRAVVNPMHVTPAYAAPEVNALGSRPQAFLRAHPRQDVWSAGVAIAEAVSGAPPHLRQCEWPLACFNGLTAGETVQPEVDDWLRRALDAPGLQKVRELVREMLRVEPWERISAREAALKARALVGEALHAKGARPFQRSFSLRLPSVLLNR
jgi:serine/threonine protein kinase